jgi:hypothetical protein
MIVNENIMKINNFEKKMCFSQRFWSFCGGFDGFIIQ